MGQGGSHWVHPTSPSSPGALRPELAEVGLVARPSAIRVLAPLHESKCKTRRLTSEYSDSRDLCARCAPRRAPAPPIRVCLCPRDQAAGTRVVVSFACVFVFERVPEA